MQTRTSTDVNGDRNMRRRAAGNRMRAFKTYARKTMVITGVAIMLYAVIVVFSTSVTDYGGNELIDGRSDTRSLLMPLALFLLGGMLLAAGIGSGRGH